MTTKTMRNFPKHTLEESISVALKIQDEMAGKPFKRLLLADALGIKPGSSNFRDLLSSSYKYGLTDGTEKASDVSLTPQGSEITQVKDRVRAMAARKKAAMTPSVFRAFYTAYQDRKLPSSEMMKKLLATEYEVGPDYVDECAALILENGRFAEIVRDVGGSPHVMLDADVNPPTGNGHREDEGVTALLEEPKEAKSIQPEQKPVTQGPRPILLCHGKKKSPLTRLEKFLAAFQIPYKVVVDEANLGRPISQKVKETMLQCGSAILIFTCDEKFLREDGQTVVWRPSENVVHELGAASFAYEDRVVIFKEKGLDFPTNFQSVGHIEFEEDSIEAKTTDLLKELIGFGLVKITT